MEVVGARVGNRDFVAGDFLGVAAQRVFSCRIPRHPNLTTQQLCHSIPKLTATMETWAKSRDTLLEAEGKAYDSVGVRIAAGDYPVLFFAVCLADSCVELDEQNTIRVLRAEWLDLQANSTRSKTLEEENLCQDQELKRCRATVARVEDLERDNKRLQRELEAALQQKKQVFETPARARLFNKDAPTPSEQPSSIKRADHNGASSISGDQYDLLVRQHNNIYEQ